MTKPDVNYILRTHYTNLSLRNLEPTMDPHGNLTYIKSIWQLNYANVTVQELVDLVIEGQKGYYPTLTIEQALEAVLDVLNKQDVLNVLYISNTIDRLGEDHKAPFRELQTMLDKDAGVFGIDETLGIESIAALYGQIGLSNAYHLDKMKPGVIGQLNAQPYTVMIDDVVAGICGGAMGRIAHKQEFV